MTDKEIIIDSIDIRKCKHFETLYESRPNGFGGITIENYCYLYEDNCEKYPQCLYRSNRLQQLETQLQREKQNSQEAMDASIREFNRAETLKTLLKRKEQECEELKKELQAQRDFTAHAQKLIYCVAYDETCKTGNDCKQKKCIFKDNIKLKQTIAKIKEITKIEIECKTYEIENDCFNETRCKALNEHIDFLKQILQKISENEVEND